MIEGVKITPLKKIEDDRGSVLRQVAARLEAYWAATCGEAGTFAWQAAQSFATAILGAMQRIAIESPDALAYLQVRCAKQGEALGRQMTVAAVFANKVYVADDDAPLEVDGLVVRVASPGSPLTAMHPLVSEASVEEVASLMHPARDDGTSGAGDGHLDSQAASRTAEDLLHAALMLQC